MAIRMTRIHPHVLSLAILAGAVAIGCGQDPEGTDRTIALTDSELSSAQKPKLLASMTLPDNGIRRIEVDHRGVLWAVQGAFDDASHPAMLQRVAVAGGAVATLASRPGETTADFSVDGSSVYWLTYAYDTTQPMGHHIHVTLSKVNKDTGVSRVLADERGGEHPYSVTTDDDSVYWIKAHSVLTLPKNGVGGAPQTLVVAGPDQTLNSIAVDDARIYYTDIGAPNPTTGCTPGAGKVWSVAKSGGAPRTLATGESCLTSLRVDSAFAYWATLLDGQVRRAAKCGDHASGNPVTTLATGASASPVPGADIALDAHHVYYSGHSPTNDAAAVFRTSKWAPSASKLGATALSAGKAIQTVSTVDSTSVYYVVAAPQDSGETLLSVMRAPKPH